MLNRIKALLAWVVSPRVRELEAKNRELEKRTRFHFKAFEGELAESIRHLNEIIRLQAQLAERDARIKELEQIGEDDAAMLHKLGGDVAELDANLAKVLAACKEAVGLPAEDVSYSNFPLDYIIGRKEFSEEILRMNN